MAIYMIVNIVDLRAIRRQADQISTHAVVLTHAIKVLIHAIKVLIHAIKVLMQDFCCVCVNYDIIIFIN